MLIPPLLFIGVIPQKLQTEPLDSSQKRAIIAGLKRFTGQCDAPLRPAAITLNGRFLFRYAFHSVPRLRAGSQEIPRGNVWQRSLRPLQSASRCRQRRRFLEVRTAQSPARSGQKHLVRASKKRIEKLRYLHRNPALRLLCQLPPNLQFPSRSEESYSTPYKNLPFQESTKESHFYHPITRAF